MARLPSPAAAAELARVARRPRAGFRMAASRALTWPAWALALLCAAPAISVCLTAAFGDWSLWSLLMRTVLPRYAGATLELAGLVAVGAGLLGVGAAVLVTGFTFPGGGSSRWR